MHVSTNAIQMILSFTKGGICKVQTVDLTNEQYSFPSLLEMLDSLRQAVALS